MRFDEATGVVEIEASEHGFSVTRVYDVHDTLASKGFAIAPLRIYVLAAREEAPATVEVVDLGADMDCKLYVHAEEGGAVITALKPTLVCGMLPDAGLEDVAADFERRVTSLVDDVVGARS
jgi:uncharacterized protein (DUF302 family)